MCLEALAVAAAAGCCGDFRRRRSSRFGSQRRFDGGFGFNGRQAGPELFRRGIAPAMNIHRCTCCPCKRKDDCCSPCCD